MMALLTYSEISLGWIFQITVESYVLQFSTLNKFQILCLLHLSQNIKAAGFNRPCNYFQWIVQLLLNFWGREGGSTYYFAFYLTFISLRMTYRKYCQKKMCVSEHLLYTQIKNISMHIIINESWCLCSQCSQRSFKHKVSVQFLLAWNVTTLH